jgi:hypothetical protein
MSQAQQDANKRQAVPATVIVISDDEEETTAIVPQIPSSLITTTTPQASSSSSTTPLPHSLVIGDHVVILEHKPGLMLMRDRVLKEV